jgi:hypothetical protein
MKTLSFEMSCTSLPSTWCHILEDLHLQKHCIENFRSLEKKIYTFTSPKQKGRHYKTKFGTESSVLVMMLEVHVINWKHLPVGVMSQKNMDLLYYWSASMLVYLWSYFENEVLVTVLHNFFSTSYFWLSYMSTKLAVVKLSQGCCFIIMLQVH